MLRVYFGERENAIYNTSVFFRNSYRDEWIIEDFTKNIVEDIDKSKVLDVNNIYNDVLGNISPTQLSGGVKALILMKHFPRKTFNASNCGDNCAKWILEIAKQQDVTINLRHIMNFGHDTSFEIYIQNGGEVVHSMKELIPIAHKYLNMSKENG